MPITARGSQPSPCPRDTANAVCGTRDRTEGFDVLRNYARAIGFPITAIIENLGDLQPVVLGDAAEILDKLGWRETNPNWMRQHPGYIKCKTTALPFESPILGESFRPTSRVQRHFQRDLIANGIVSVFYLPVRFPSGRLSVITWASSMKLDAAAAVTKHWQDLIVIGYSFFEMLDRTAVRSPSRVNEAVATLPDRFVDCLYWSARGKTKTEIAKILGISQPTVREYLAEAARRLGASNTTHATVIACQKGLITL